MQPHAWHAARARGGRWRAGVARAAAVRFVMPAETKPEVQYDNRTHKRRSDDDTIHKTLLQLCGNDSWSPAICGYAHKLKRSKLRLYDDAVRNAMVGVY